MQCQGDVITEDYLNFPKESCPNMSEPCWIPQVQDILPKNITSKLFLCDSVEKYICMLSTAMSSRKNVKKQCKRPCEAESYKITPRTNTIESFTKVLFLEIFRYYHR